MDKGKSKTDLRAAGKKRLEEFRQKRQQKGSSTKSSTTTALKALTESEQSPGEHVVEEISRDDSLPKEDSQGSSSEKDGKVELLVDHVDEFVKAREEHHEVNVIVDPSPAPSVPSSIQRLKVGGHLAPEASEQGVESPCEPGSSNGNSLEDKDREAVYTILWENHGTDHPQRNEEWQERSFDGRADLDERALDSGNYSTFRLDDEHYGSESREGLSTQRKLSGNLVDAVDKFHSSEGIKEWDEHSNSLAPSQQTSVHDAEAEDVSPVDPCFKANSLFTNEGSIEQRMLPQWTEKLEKEKADMVSEIALLLQKLEQIVEESGREREFHENEISSLKFQVREKDEAVSTRDAQLEELAAVKMLSEQKLRTALDITEKEKEQLILECMDVKAQVERLAEERDKFLSSIDVHEKNLEALRANSTKLAAQMDCVSQEKDQLSTELCAAREQAAEAHEHEAKLLLTLKELEEERESERTRLQKLQVQLEDIVSEKMLLEVRLGESTNVLEELRLVNKQVSDELSVSEQERLNVAEERNMLTDRIKIMEDEQLKFHALVENLTHRLSMYEEKEEASKALNVQVKNFEEECKRLESVVENLGTNLQSLEDEKAELGSKFRGLQVEKEELIIEVEIAKNELKVAQSQLEFFRTQQSEIVDELSSVKLELSKELADKTKMQLDEEESRQRLEHLKDQYGKFEIERNEIVESFGQKLQIAEDNIRALEEQRVSLEEQSARAKHELEELNERLRQVDVEKAKLKETSAIAIEALEQQVRRLGGERSELEEQCQTLRVELQLSNERVNTLAAEKVEMEATAELLHQKAMVLEDRNSDLDQRLNALVEEKDRLTSELASSQRTWETILEEGVQLKSELRLSQEELLKIKEEKAHIRSDWEVLQEKLNGIITEKESVVNQLKESQDDVQKMSEESRSVTSELSVAVKKLDESTDLKNKLISDLQFLQEMLQEVEEAKARVETELEESLSKLNDSIQEKTLLSNKLETLLHSVQVLETEKLEFISQVQQLQEAINQKDEEVTICREERRQSEVDYSAKVETEVAKSHELTTEICNLKAELQTLEQQLVEQREQKNKACDEPYSPTADKESEHLTLEGFENASPRSHAANVKLVKKLVEVFEGKITEDVPIQNQRGLTSPVTQFFIQAQAMKKTTDNLQRERDAAVLAESTLRADVDALTKKLHDVSEEKVTLQALVKELQDNLETVTADCIHLNQTIYKLMNGDGEGVKMVAVLKGDKCELQAQNLEFAEKLRAAEVSIQSMFEDQALKQDLQQRSEELDAKLQTERAALEKMLNGVDLLSNYIEEHVLTMISELEWTSGSADAVSQVEYKLALLVEKVLPELVWKAHTLEEERDLARKTLHITAESNNELEVERNALISEKEILKAEIEEKMTNETEARAEYEGQIRALTSSLEEAGNELKMFKNERIDFEKKLLMVVTREFPDHIVEPSGSVESTFDFCWFLIEAMLDGTSKKLLDVRMELSSANTELNDLLALERLQHQASIVDVEAGREVLQQEKNELSEKIKLLEEERTWLQEEEERVIHEWQALLELETKANLERQEKIQMLESTMDDLQRGLEERKAVEAEARSVHERDVKLLNSKLQSAQSELDKIRESHIHFDEKLECAAREVLPTIELKPVDFEDNRFDYSLAVVNLILEEYSRKLQHAYADLTELESKMNTGKEEEIQGLQELVQKITEELAVAKEERNVAQSELALSEKRLASTKERLTLAINKGKSIVVQRDAVKATLAEKNGELQRLASEYKEMMQLKDSALQEAQAEILSLKAKADQAEILIVELAEAHHTSERLESSLSETRSALSELETAVDKINLVADGMPKTGVAKIHWVAAKLKDLQMRLSYFENKAESLIVDLTTVSNEKELVWQELQDVTSKCKRLEKNSDDHALNIAALTSEIENLQEMIATMKAEAAQHMKMQHAVSRAMGVLDSSGRDSEADPTPSSLFSETELDAAVSFHVNKYKSAVHELNELRKQSSSLRDAIRKLEEEKAFVSAEKLQSLEAMLQARDTELRDTIAKLQEVTRVISEKDEETKIYVEQNESLEQELIKCKEDLGMLSSNLSTAEEKMIGMKSELQEVVDSFKSIPEERSFQVEGVTRSMNEMIMEVSSLVKTIIEQTKRRGIELQDANERATAALMLESNTVKELAKFEQEFLVFKNVARGVSWLNVSAPSSSSLLDWATWLIDALKEEHQTAERALQEIESLTKTAEENALELQLLQGKSGSLFVELSNQQHQKEVVADELRRRELELQIVEDKVQKLAENKIALESEVESLRSMARIETALIGIEEIVEDIRLQGRPSSSSSPREWISWLILALQEEQKKVRQAAQEFETFKSTTDALTHQVEEAKNKCSSLCEELSIQKDENENLQNKLREVYETFNVERDSLKSEIQVLRDSSTEISSREIEFSEAQLAVTNLQETLAFKDKELSELRNEIEDLSLRYTQRDLKLQSLMEERKRLISELVEVEAESNNLRTEMAEAVNEKSILQSDINQLEQKLVAVREKLNLAIKKGKGLEKQRDTLKQSLAEETAKVESMVLSHRKEIHLKDLELLETRAQANAMDTRVQELQAEVMSLHKIATTSQQRMQTERQRLESALSGIEMPKDVQFRDPLEKVEWLVSLLEGTRNTTKLLEGELDNSRNALETLKSALRDAEERLQSVTNENFKAQETISLWVKIAEEVESRATFDRAQYENEIDGLTRALKEADLRQQADLSHAKELEKTLEKHQSTINASEAARSRAVSKLTFTRNKLNLLVQQSQELVRECESLHKSLQERNAEIAELNHEIARLKNIIQVEQSQSLDAGSEVSSHVTLLQEELARTSEKSAATAKELRELQAALQRVVGEKDSELEGVRRKLEDILLKGDNVLWMEHNFINQNKGDDSLGEIGVQSMNGSQDLASVITALGQRFDNLVSDTQTYRSSSDKKEGQIQKLKKELHDASVEKALLQAGVQAKTMEVKRLKSEVNAKGVSVEDGSSAQSEIEELGTRNNWAGLGNPATPHVRGPRRPVQAEVAIDVDNEDSSHLLSDMNDKEHGFSALTNSRLVPKATRILADRLDGLWFAGGRILTRQPTARLGLAVYWILIHVYMATIFSRVVL